MNHNHNQVQRIVLSKWRTLCKCRVCGVLWYESLDKNERERMRLVRWVINSL